ncbi:hypothetical protein [Natrialbaceae archaeon AArc-T1-2]|uniref:hypothetical protein n=1 Tax=Natrialbaceae archaeon AArc-T1-2 TaxID=3053904 RepID=UPI00255AD545|nr:hypothetical protein [Natrialbaceae archaeon AArc-T1-2]WIV68859.1 hypothetical protein QQ977_16285 [Natrialbaceae archaeon AArc-T1-2]
MSTSDTDIDDVRAETASDASPTDDPSDEEPDRTELLATIELLREENRRLRNEYARARQSRYRNTALGLAALGIAAVFGAVVFPDTRGVLIALGATGLFGGVLTYYLTPERVVSATVGERVYAAAGANGDALVDELGLRDDRIYLPPGDTDAVRLYVPRYADPELPVDRTGPIVTDESGRGLLFEPTGRPLFTEFERTTDPAETPVGIATQLADALVEAFELADSVDPDVDREHERITFAVSGSAFGDLDRFDHPIPSFVAVGLVTVLERPVSLSVTAGGERADWLVTCQLEG